MPMVEFKHVEKYYGKFHALKKINLSFEKGEVVVVIGPSGSGKSTMLRCINGLEDISSGELLVNNKNLHSKEVKLKDIRKNIGMVFQHFNLYPNKTALENITLAPIKVLKQSPEEATKAAEKLLDRVDMLDKKDSYPSMLSGGQQQRIAIARGLAMNPDLLLFDEPTSALDVKSIKKVLKIIRNLKAKGMAILIITHDIGFANDINDKIIKIGS